MGYARADIVLYLLQRKKGALILPIQKYSFTTCSRAPQYPSLSYFCPFSIIYHIL